EVCCRPSRPRVGRGEAEGASASWEATPQARSRKGTYGFLSDAVRSPVPAHEQCTSAVFACNGRGRHRGCCPSDLVISVDPPSSCGDGLFSAVAAFLLQKMSRIWLPLSSRRGRDLP